MFGQKKTKLVLIECACCHMWQVVRLDPEDLERHHDGIFVQDAFLNRDGTIYLSAAERELLISGFCNACWSRFCSSDPLAYS